MIIASLFEPYIADSHHNKAVGIVNNKKQYNSKED
jgi:hypothetical protein